LDDKNIGGGLRGDVRWERSIEFLKQLAGLRVRDRVPGVHSATVELLSGVLGFPVGAGSFVAGINFTLHLSHFARRAPTVSITFVFD
jgi:hypothetical protein